MLRYEHIVTSWLGLTAFVVCLLPKLVVPCIAGLLLLVVFGYVRKKLEFNINYPALAMVGLYVTYLIGTFFTLDRPLANHYLESKLSFVIFPLLLSFRFRQPADFRPVVIGLAAGIVGVSVAGWVNSVSTYRATGQFMASFTTSHFSNIHHPSYYCIFILTSATLIWYGYRQQWKGFHLKWIMPLLVYYLLIYGLCLSLAGMLYLFLLGAVVALRVIRNRFGKKGFLAALVVTPVLTAGMFLLVPQMQLQFGDASRFFLEYTKSPSAFIQARPDYKEGNEIRLIMWTVAAQEFADHPMGVGTGNVDLHLSKRLLAYGQLEMGKQDENGHIAYNPHNQYLQTAMEIGIIGLLLLLWLLGATLRIAHKYRFYPLTIMVTALAFNACFESVFQRQSGIVFFSFFIGLLILYLRSPKQTSSEAFADMRGEQ